MKIVIFSILLFVTAVADEPKQNYLVETTMRFSTTAAGHVIEMTIHQGPIDSKQHRLEGGRDHEDRAKDKPATIDGVKIAGTDGVLPSIDPVGLKLNTITKIALKWDGKIVPVDPKHHINLFRLPLDPEAMQIIPSEKGDAILIQARGGDGGGSYLVSLVLRKNGKHHQYDWMYCEGGLPPFPYEVEYLAGEHDGNPVIGSFNWLKPKPEQPADGKTPEAH